MATNGEGVRKRASANTDPEMEEEGVDESSTNGGHLEYRHRAQSFIDSKALDELETEVFETGLYENIDVSGGSRYGVMAAEIVYSYLWWSVTSCLPGVVWFYPLCAMEVSGFETVAFLWMSPVLMGVGPFRRFLTSPLGLLMMRLGSLVGVASYQAPSTLSRLLVLGVGNFFSMLVLAGGWWEKSKLDRHRHIYLHLLGFLFFLAVRIWGKSFNFIFMSTASNFMAVCVGVVVSAFLYQNDARTPITTPPSPAPGKTPPPPLSPAHGRTTISSHQHQYPGLLATAIGFGALLYLTELLYGEVSVVTRWAVGPLPHSGPAPMPWGFMTMLALTVGVAVFGHQTSLLTSWRWTGLGLVFAMILYFMNTYTAFFGGIMLAVYTMSLWPLMAKRVVNFPAHKVLPLAMLTFIFYMLLSAWVVAYNFVPGGTITRERTDAMLVMLVLSCGMGSRIIPVATTTTKGGGAAARGNSDTYKRAALRKKVDNQKRNSTIKFLGQAIRRLSTVTEEAEEEDMESPKESDTHKILFRQVAMAEDKEAQSFHDRVLQASLLIVLIALFGFISRAQPPIPMPHKEHPNVVSGAIWAFHFGYDNRGWPSMERAAQLIENTEVDVIGLLETDAARPYIGSHDLASWLGERLRMHVDYGPGTKDHTWGTMVLSKYPILKSEHYLLPSPEGEIAPAILATVNVSGSIINFYIVHFGNDVDDLDRKLQAQKTAEILSGSTYPVVMLSYITNRHGSRDYMKIVNDGNVKDIDPTDKKRYCEYIFYQGLIKLGYARVSNGGLSDTEVQIGKFLIPTDKDQPDNSVVTQDPNKVPDWVQFPKRFGKLYHGHYASQAAHHYHMSTPKYFLKEG